MTVFILLPAYNEEDAVDALLPRVFAISLPRQARARVVIVNDGSTDDTESRARAYQDHHDIEIIRHPINRGLGETIRDGIEYCVREGEPGDVIIRMDCDDSQDPAYIPDILAKIDSGFDVVQCSRFQPGGGDSGVARNRKILSHLARFFMKAMFPMRGVRDYSCGYRGYTWEILRAALDCYGNDFIEQKHLGFSCTLEKLVKLRMLGARIAEVAHILRYDRKVSESKMASGPTTLGYLLLAFRYNAWCGVGRGKWRRRIAELNRRDAQRTTAQSTTTQPENAPCAASPVV